MNFPRAPRPAVIFGPPRHRLLSVLCSSQVRSFFPILSPIPITLAGLSRWPPEIGHPYGTSTSLPPALRARRMRTDAFINRVGGTVVLISFIAFSSQIFVIWPWYGREISLDLLKLLVPLKFVISLFLDSLHIALSRSGLH